MSASGTAPICPSCAGQIASPSATSCQWCGASLIANEATSVATAPPAKPAPVRHDVGFGGTEKPLPPLPPPPKSRPITVLNPGQIVMRAAIVVALAYIFFTVARMLMLQACNIPGSPLCR